MSEYERCVGYSHTAGGQCWVPVQYRVEASIFGQAAPFLTCGRHLSWAIRLRLAEPGGAVHEVTTA